MRERHGIPEYDPSKPPEMKGDVASPTTVAPHCDLRVLKKIVWPLVWR
jgi:hypothetical protein